MNEIIQLTDLPTTLKISEIFVRTMNGAFQGRGAFQYLCQNPNVVNGNFGCAVNREMEIRRWAERGTGVIMLQYVGIFNVCGEYVEQEYLTLGHRYLQENSLRNDREDTIKFLDDRLSHDLLSILVFGANRANIIEFAKGNQIFEYGYNKGKSINDLIDAKRMSTQTVKIITENQFRGVELMLERFNPKLLLLDNQLTF